MRDADIHREVPSISPIGPIGLMLSLLLPLQAEEQRLDAVAERQALFSKAPEKP